VARAGGGPPDISDARPPAVEDESLHEPMLSRSGARDLVIRASISCGALRTCAVSSYDHGNLVARQAEGARRRRRVERLNAARVLRALPKRLVESAGHSKKENVE
jgi:hypothetical protein